jgi:hypothetical protein
VQIDIFIRARIKRELKNLTCSLRVGPGSVLTASPGKDLNVVHVEFFFCNMRPIIKGLRARSNDLFSSLYEINKLLCIINNLFSR